MKKAVMKYWSAALVILLVPCFISLASMAVIVHTRPLMQSLLDTYSQDPKDAKDTLDYYYSYIVQPGNDLPKIPGMTDTELSHLRDVKAVWLRGIIALALSTIALLLVMWHAKRKKMLWSALEWGSLLTIALMIGAALVPFDQLFIWFHAIAFPQGNWTFAYSDKIITLFPPPFFEAAALRIGVLALILAFVTYGISFVGKKLHARKERKSKEVKTAA
jgi:integral membrane protein (TIGR01906 family)